MTPDAYLFVVAVILATLLAGCIGAAIVELLGAERVARALRLPWEGGER